MGRVKLQIKRIENTTNRQVTFSKRKNGLIKKAYELSVLCDVDLALILFSPSGRLTTFSADNKSIEDILVRYMNLPEHERGRLHNEEYLIRTLGKLQCENKQSTRAGASISPSSEACVTAHLERIQQEILRYRSELEEKEKRLRIFEGDPYEMTTLQESEYREKVLEETLKHVRLQKQILEEREYNSANAQSTSQIKVQMPHETINLTDLSTTATISMLDWVPQRNPQAQFLNFLDSNGLLPIRHEEEGMENLLPQTLSMSNCGPNMEMKLLSESTSTSSTGNGMQHHNHHEVAGLGVIAAPAAAADLLSEARPHFGQVIDVNLSPWTQFYPPDAGIEPFSSSHPRERRQLELYLSQFTPPT